MVKLIVIRHGNTFNKGDIVTRVGGRTDLPLVESGLEQGRRVGTYLKAHNLIPDVVFAAPLKRTMETARQAGFTDVRSLDIFTEIDYGPDENKPEEAVVERLGQEALDRWNKEAIVPNGWKVDVQKIIKDWLSFSSQVALSGKTTAVFSSNGIMRFIPHITGDFEKFTETHDIKVGTGRICIFEFDAEKGRWICTGWNIKPE